MNEAIKVLGIGVLVLCSLAVLIFIAICVVAVFVSEPGQETPKPLRIIGWLAMLAVASYIAGLAWIHR